MMQAVLKKNDRKARILIFSFSALVFAAVMVLGRVKLDVKPGFDVHLFARANAIINSFVALLLIIALVAVKSKNYKLHRNLMMTAMFLSVLFLLSYICHHLLAGETRFGDLNHDGIQDPGEPAFESCCQIQVPFLESHESLENKLNHPEQKPEYLKKCS